MSRLATRPATPPARVRSGGRSERVRLQVARACLDLLGEGDVGFGPSEVASRAGVSRATVHRWWPTKADLLREALTLHTRDLDVPDTGTWAGDVSALAAQLAVFFSDPVEVSQNAIMASGEHPDYNAAVLEHYGPLFVAWRGMVERGRERGEVRADVDADAVLRTLSAPLIVGPLIFRRAVSAAEAAAVADLLIAATTARP